MFKVTARDQGHYKGPSGAFVTYCNISCSFEVNRKFSINILVDQKKKTNTKQKSKKILSVLILFSAITLYSQHGSD